MTDATLPVALDAERLVLGSILLDDSLYLDVASLITADQFSDDKHRRIFGRMADLHDRGEKIDRITVYHELQRAGETEACGGLTYLISLDDGLPKISNADAYARIVREKAELRRVMLVSQRIFERAALEQESADTLLAEMATAALDTGERKGDAQTVGQIIDAADGMDAYFSRSGLKGLMTGFPKLDELTGGLKGGDLFILAARPSMGKTALALNIAYNVAVRGQHVAVFSLEMSRAQLVDRLLSASARVDSWAIQHGRLTAESRGSVAQAIGATWDTIHIQDRSQCKGLDVHSECRRIKSRTGLALVVVDYLQLMASDGENRTQEVARLSRGLKIAARDLNVPFIVLSQLSRGVESDSRGDHRPRLSDLRDSGAIEQDADIVGFIYRPEVYKPERQDLRGLADLLIEKHRNGPTGAIPLTFLRHCVRFESRAEGEPVE